MKNKAIQKAIDIAGGQKKLADLCGVSQPTVWRWLHGGGVDARLVMSIVKATNNAVLPNEIRPDLYELIGTGKQ
ncbi:helix-turn-helix domain-containing protein [Providencia manganoxydans]|uniref:helix-turn-helix domain-containing protein n=1 Tax=Providencia manganoxydans TaxID=2923283 RepID=UPI0034E5B6FC